MLVIFMFNVSALHISDIEADKCDCGSTSWADPDLLATGAKREGEGTGKAKGSHQCMAGEGCGEIAVSILIYS